MKSKACPHLTWSRTSFIIALVSLFLYEGECFFCHPRVRSLRRVHLTASTAVNGENGSENEVPDAPIPSGFGGDCKIESDDDELRSKSTARRKSRRRCVTYPSFAYEDPGRGTRNSFVSTGSAVVDSTALKTRLLNNRSYANPAPFEIDNIATPPSLSDLSIPGKFLDKFFISTPANIVTFAVAYFCFPLIMQLLDAVIKTSTSNLDEMLSSFGPGISILYGTFVSLTISTLYNRQRTIQDTVGNECAFLTVILRSMLNLFREDLCKLEDAGQCVAGQIRTLVRSSRGEELMGLMYSDPYARMLELVDIHETDLYRKSDSTGSRSGNLIAFCRDTLRELVRLRARRLSDETLALPPTHFFILNILTAMILLSYSVSVVPTVDVDTGLPPNESSLLFASLATVYVLFFNFASDLNNPFQGVYQIRRSCATTHLLEAKWVIANHRGLAGKVDFEEIPEEDGAVMVRSPGLGNFYFDRDAIYQDRDDEEAFFDLPLPE